MAKYLSSKLNGDNVLIQNYQLVVVACVLLLESIVSARPAPALQIGTENGSENKDFNADSSLFGSTWLGVVLSLSFLAVLVTLLALCGAGGCCGKIHWFGRPRQDAPLSFSNPMTEPGATMMMPISQIDVRALELDPIVFEPLPTVHDLTPISGKSHSERGQPNHRGAGIPIVPFSVDDSNVYAHDWFEEPHNNFPRSNIEYVKELGKGWFGQVIEAEARDIVPFARKIRVTVKVLREDANGMEQMRFLDESRMYRDANHGNILKLLGHSIEKLPFILIMEQCPQGDLKSFLISNVIRAEMLNSQGTIIKMALDIAKGLEWLHTAGFIHQDLAARNCQVGSDNRVVIGDYGLGTQNYKDDYHWSSNVAIPLRWTAPETLHCTSSVIQILKVTESSNIWTYGVVLWEICEFGKLPYFELADDEVISRVIIDQNYFLGRPTLQCMSAKEELYKIMSSCWQADLEHRPGLSAIITCLENLLKAFNVSVTPPRDDFESKWEQLGSRTNSEEEKRRKKNVSFVGLLDMSKSLQFEPSSLEEDQSEIIRNADNTRHTNGMLDLSHDLIVDQSKDFTDAEEEQWMQKFERGDITQKVLEKSQSVQDLMVLTHFDQSDMGDPDSLIIETKSPQSSVIEGKENESNSTLRKSCSETAIDSLSFTSSSHTLTPSSVCDSQNSTLVPPELNVSPSTPTATTPNIVGIDINVIAATPNPNVEINVIEATPSRPSSSKKEDTTDRSNDNVDNSNTTVNRKLRFKLDSDSSPLQAKGGRQRQTSTPLRSGSTPSPRISDYDDNEDDLPVFDSSGHFMEGTFSLSPISQHCVTSSSFNSSLLEKTVSEPEPSSSVLFGASDDHELGSYQGVKSQLFQSAFLRYEDESDDEKSKFSKTTLSNPKALPRRVLFPNGEVNGTSNSNDDALSSPNLTEQPKNGTHAEVIPASSAESAEVDAAENDEFWQKQLKSLQLAAGNTRELFQIGLNDPEEIMDANATDDKRFVEDIEAAAEELGSLVLHDLEDTDSKKTVIKETREAIGPDAGVNAKLAFESRATNLATTEETQSSVNCVQNSVADQDDKMWDINNSIEIRKFKEGHSTVVETETELQDVDEAVTKEFVPSKWNQSLLPSRPAIKSPEQQPKACMKKSVSFEMNKTQLVYEYPPPPVTSDSEEEEKIITPLASASVPMSSSLDWELTQEELEDAEINHEDWDDDVLPKPGDPMDVYRISGFSDDNFQVRGSNEPFVFSPSTLGELRHTRDRLRLDLSRGEANFLEEEASKSNAAKLDSGVGSSTNVSPFNNCDILTKQSKNSE